MSEGIFSLGRSLHLNPALSLHVTTGSLLRHHHRLFCKAKKAGDANSFSQELYAPSAQPRHEWSSWLIQTLDEAPEVGLSCTPMKLLRPGGFYWFLPPLFKRSLLLLVVTEVTVQLRAASYSLKKICGYSKLLVQCFTRYSLRNLEALC